MRSKYIKNLLGALVLVSLAACSGSGSCPPGTNGGSTGEITLKLTAPNQYPAGLPTPITAYLTMTNTSDVNATNLYYAIPTATNYTGVGITVANDSTNPCRAIAAHQSCTFPVIIGAYANPGAFTVTATPTVASQSTISKLVSKAENKLGLQSGTLELTANIGLTSIPANSNSGANGVTFLYAQTIKQNLTGATLVSIVGVVSSASAGVFNNINLTDTNGNLLNFENLSGASVSPLTQNSIVTFLLEIPAGVSSYSFYGQTTNNGSVVNQGNIRNTINLSAGNVGILNVQPQNFSLLTGYESQIVTYTNIGSGSVSGIDINLPSPLILVSNDCAGKTLASGDSCNYVLRFDTTSLVAGTTTLVANYNNGQSGNNEVDSTVNYTPANPLVGLAVNGNSNPNFIFNSDTVQTTESSLVTLTNNGSVQIYQLSFNPPTHFSTSTSGVTNPCGATLESGVSCNLSLIYTNGSVTDSQLSADATVSYKYKGINQNESSGSSNVTLSYQTTQATAALSILPLSYAFGNVLNNNVASSPEQTFTITNSGSNPASGVSFSFTESDASLFSVTNTSNCPSPIPGNSTCTITAKFGPIPSNVSAGTKSAQLAVQYAPYSSASPLTTKAPVTGQAVTAQSAIIGNSAATPTGFETGAGTSDSPYSVTQGNAAPTLTYTFTNSGSVAAIGFYLDASSLDSKWTLVSGSNNCGTLGSKITLAAGGTCSFSVQVTTTATAQANNFIPSQIVAYWVDEDSPGGQSVALSGDTVYASVVALPQLTVSKSGDPVVGGACSTITATVPAPVSFPTLVTFNVTPTSALYGFGAGPGGPFSATASCTISATNTSCSTSDGGDLCAGTGSGGASISVTGSATGYQNGNVPLTITSAPTITFSVPALVYSSESTIITATLSGGSNVSQSVTVIPPVNQGITAIPCTVTSGAPTCSIRVQTSLTTPGGTTTPVLYSLTTSAGSATASPSSINLPVNTHYNSAAGIVINSAGTIAYITNAGTTGNTNTRSKVVQCNITNGAFTSCAISAGATGFSAPQGITLNSAGTKQYLAVNGPSNNKAFQCIVDGAGDLSSCTSAYSVGGRYMVDIKLTSNDAYAYLSTDNYNSVYQCSINGAGAFTCNTATPAVGQGSGGMCQPEMMTIVGTKLYIASQSYTDNDDPQFSCVDAVTYCTIDNSTGAVSDCTNASVQGLDQPFGIALNPAGTFAYITNWNTNTVKCAVNGANGSLSGCGVSGASGGNGITLNPTGTRAYIVNNNKVQICAVDGSTGVLSNCNNYY